MLTLILLNPDLIVSGFNDTSTPVGHFVSSPKEREKRDRGDSRGDERGGGEGGGERKRKMNESEETEEIKTFPSTLICCNTAAIYTRATPCCEKKIVRRSSGG